MKFTCTQENLNKGLSIVSHIAGRNATLPILNNVLIKATEGLIRLSTTNLEIGTAVNIRGKVDAPGEFTVQAKLFSDYINLLNHEKVEIELEEQTLNIIAKNYQTTIKGVEASDFPLIPEINQDKPLEFMAADLKKALTRVIFAAAVDESRPEISGVLFSFSGGLLTLAGTDSYRLAEAKIKYSGELAEDKKIIVPLRTLQELVRILGESFGNKLVLFVEDNQILFRINDEVELTSRLIEGEYPDYQQIIPDQKNTTAKVKTTELVRVIKSASLFCKPGINDVKLSFVKDKNEIIITAVNSAVGENLINVEAVCEGDDNEAVFNYRYLLDGLNNLNTDEVNFELISGSAPGTLRPVGDDNYLYIIMPIRQ